MDASPCRCPACDAANPAHARFCCACGQAMPASTAFPPPVHMASGGSEPVSTALPFGTLCCIYRGHTSGVTALAWSPEGQSLASGDQDSTVQVWSATDGGHLFPYRGHADPVTALAWSPDGRRIASGSADRTVQVWDATSGVRACTYLGHTDVVRAVAWSPDGKRIASGSDDQTVQVWAAG